MKLLIIGFLHIWLSALSAQDIRLEKSDASQDLCNGYIRVVASDNTEYTYQWSTGASGSFINELCPGLYSVTVSDEGNCLT